MFFAYGKSIANSTAERTSWYLSLGMSQETPQSWQIAHEESCTICKSPLPGKWIGQEKTALRPWRKNTACSLLFEVHRPESSDTCSATTLQQRSFSSQQMEIITENHRWIQCRDQWIMGSPDAMDTSTLQLLHLCSGDIRRGCGKIARARTPGVCLLWQFPSRNGYMNKTGTGTISIGVLIQRRKISQGPTLSQRIMGN